MGKNFKKLPQKKKEITILSDGNGGGELPDNALCTVPNTQVSVHIHMVSELRSSHTNVLNHKFINL